MNWRKGPGMYRTEGFKGLVATQRHGMIATDYWAWFSLENNGKNNTNRAFCFFNCVGRSSNKSEKSGQIPADFTHLKKIVKTRENHSTKE